MLWRARRVRRGLTGVAVMIFLLVGGACSPSEQQGSRQEDQGAQPTTEEGARAGEPTGTDLAGLLNEPTYRTVTDDTKALRVEGPSGWEELTGEDSEAGNSWSSFRGESVGASIAGSSDLNAWPLNIPRHLVTPALLFVLCSSCSASRWFRALLRRCVSRV
jgi:hypothetical protein